MNQFHLSDGGHAQLSVEFVEHQTASVKLGGHGFRNGVRPHVDVDQENGYWFSQGAKLRHIIFLQHILVKHKIV